MAHKGKLNSSGSLQGTQKFDPKILAIMAGGLAVIGIFIVVISRAAVAYPVVFSSQSKYDGAAKKSIDKIAFATNANGSVMTTISLPNTQNDTNTGPRYSPDHRTIAWVGQNTDGTSSRIRIYDTSSRKTVTISMGQHEYLSNLAWSPNSNKMILSTTNESTHTYQLRSLDRSGRGLTIIAGSAFISDNYGTFGSMAVLGDNITTAYSYNGDIYTQTPANSAVRLVQAAYGSSCANIRYIPATATELSYECDSYPATGNNSSTIYRQKVGAVASQVYQTTWASNEANGSTHSKIDSFAWDHRGSKLVVMSNLSTKVSSCTSTFQQVISTMTATGTNIKTLTTGDPASTGCYGGASNGEAYKLAVSADDTSVAYVSLADCATGKACQKILKTISLVTANPTPLTLASGVADISW